MSREPAEAAYELRATYTVRRALSESLPEAVAAAAREFVTGPLLLTPIGSGNGCFLRWTTGLARVAVLTRSSTESTTRPAW